MAKRLKLTPEAEELKKAYSRKYYLKNRDRIIKRQEAYWEGKVAFMKAEARAEGRAEAEAEARKGKV